MLACIVARRPQHQSVPSGTVEVFSSVSISYRPFGTLTELGGPCLPGVNSWAIFGPSLTGRKATHVADRNPMPTHLAETRSLTMRQPEFFNNPNIPLLELDHLDGLGGCGGVGGVDVDDEVLEFFGELAF